MLSSYKVYSLEKMHSNFSFMRENVLVLTICRALWTISISIAWPFFPLYIGALGGSTTDIGLVYTLGGLAGLILYPVGGYIADYKG